MYFGHTMLDFGAKPKGPPPPFSLDKRDQVRRTHMRKREWRAAIMLPVAIVAVGLFIHFLMKMRDDLSAIKNSAMIETDLRLAPMAQPVLADAQALPSSSALEAQKEGADQLLANPRGVYLHIGELDALTLAWARAQLELDAQNPPVPQRLIARDMVLNDVHAGVPALVSGRLEDSIEAPIDGSDERYRRLLLALDEHQFAEVLAPADSAQLVVGHDVQLVGRFLGYDHLPAVDGTKSTVPLLMARVVRPVEAAEAPDTGAEWSHGGPAALPEHLFDEVSDERTMVETRPYYYLLGQVKLDLSTGGVYDKALDLNTIADDVHQDPDSFRDKPMTVRGVVYRAWEDAEVAQDKPFAVSRAIRVLFYKRDYGPITETIDGVEQKRNKFVQRLFEASISGDQPLPEQGEAIQVTGRFLKFHAIPVKSNDARDRAHSLQRQSDKVYTYFLVGNAYQLLPPPKMYDFSLVEKTAVAIIIVMVVMFWRLSRREKVAAENVQVQIKKLRRTRNVLVEKSAKQPIPSPIAETPSISPSPPAPTEPPPSG